ncbi:MAG: indole-3-glycerol-phosphate synthase [Deltaproteobacteria bacterium]|nr:indole-3-glycerol-phosphate synthase [Deltaproteobacteria bacterium]
MLERFRAAKAEEVAALKELSARGALPPPYRGPRPSFLASLRKKAPRAVIAEYKRASPSRGDINLGPEPEEVALAYAGAGAGAISVLTEEKWFKGHISYLERMAAPGLPLLRKDFILHPLQVLQTAAGPASALLLIARLFADAAPLRALLRLCLDSGLEAVTEVFAPEELSLARAAGASVIQVNNRDLDALQLDLSHSERLAPHKKPGEFWITASGIGNAAQLDRLLALGFDAALVGGALMQGADPGKSLAALLSGGGHA